MPSVHPELPKRHPAEIDEFITRFKRTQGVELQLELVNKNCDPHYIKTRIEGFDDQVKTAYFQIVGGYLESIFTEEPVTDLLVFCARYTNIATYLNHVRVDGDTREIAQSHDVFKHINSEQLAQYTEIASVHTSLWTEFIDTSIHQLRLPESVPEKPELEVTLQCVYDAETNSYSTRTIHMKNKKGSSLGEYLPDPSQSPTGPTVTENEKLPLMLKNLAVLRSGLARVGLKHDGLTLPNRISIPADETIQTAIQAERRVLRKHQVAVVDAFLDKLPTHMVGDHAYIGPWSKSDFRKSLIGLTRDLDENHAITRVDYASYYSQLMDGSFGFALSQPAYENNQQVNWEGQILWVYQDRTESQLVDAIASAWGSRVEQNLSMQNQSIHRETEQLTMKDAMELAKSMAMPTDYVSKFEHDTEIALRSYVAYEIPNIYKVYETIRKELADTADKKTLNEFSAVVNELILLTANDVSYITLYPENAPSFGHPHGLKSPDFSTFTVDAYQKLARKCNDLIVKLRDNHTTEQEHLLIAALDLIGRVDSSTIRKNFSAYSPGVTDTLTTWTTPQVSSFTGVYKKGEVAVRRTSRANLVPNVSLYMNITEQRVYPTVSLKVSRTENQYSITDLEAQEANETLRKITEAAASEDMPLAFDGLTQPVSFAVCRVGDQDIVIPISVGTSLSGPVMGGGGGGNIVRYSLWQGAEYQNAER